VLAKIEYKADKLDRRNPATGHRIVELATDATSHDVLNVLRDAIAEIGAFTNVKHI
jgi:hypothetical protein